MNVSRLLLLGVIALTPSPVLAHTGAGEIMSFSSGLTHPVHGLDHVLAMLAVRMWAGCWDAGQLWDCLSPFSAPCSLGWPSL